MIESRTPLVDLLTGAPGLSRPVLARPGLAQERFEAWRAALPASGALRTLLGRPWVAALLTALADHSPYLWRLAILDAVRLEALLETSPQASLEAALDGMDAACARLEIGPAEAMRPLRAGKATVALLVALADLGGVFTLDDVLAALTAFADRAVRAALGVLLRQADATGRLTLPDPQDPATGCGLVVLALGKHGAGELNYSSDIDIVVYFDPRAAAIPQGTPAAPVYVKLTQSLARMLSDRTEDGYVLRVDLRLRPDPGSTAVAIGLASAFTYYATYGQNWERAALIKARPVAGDLDLGAVFLRDLSPFIWRKYFDYDAIYYVVG